jgi:hypothetical protein
LYIGIGTFLFPPVMNYIIERYEWQGALLFQSGIILTCALFGMLYRPLKPTKGNRIFLGIFLKFAALSLLIQLV